MSNLSLTPKTYCNPMNLNYNFHPETPFREAADPSIAIFNDEYYLFASKSQGYWYSSDLLNWTYVYVTEEQLPTIMLYAPTVVVIDGYMYYQVHSCHCENILVYKTSDPKNPDLWEVVPNTADMGFDPQFFYDKDTKRLWFVHGCNPNGKIHIQELDTKTIQKIGKEYTFHLEDIENHGWERTGDNNQFSHIGWTEGAQLLKYNGKYYLIYSGYALDNSYANGVYVSDSPTGPYEYQSYSPFSQKLTGFIGGAGHGEVFEDKYGNWWNVTCQNIHVQDHYERRLGLYPTGFDKDGYLNTNTMFADYPIIMAQGHRNHFESHLAGWRLLSRRKIAKASSTVEGHEPLLAFDESVKTWWSARTSNPGEWLQVDLQDECTVNAIQVNFAEMLVVTYELSERYIQYKIEYSLDGENWSMLIDKTNNTTDVPHDYLELSNPIKARYVKITNQHTAGGGLFAIRGLRIFGNAGKTALAETVFSVQRDLDDGRNAMVRWKYQTDADGYVIRYGTAPDKLYRSYEIYDRTSHDVRSLNKGVDYNFTVDSFNQSGYTYGTKIAKI